MTSRKHGIRAPRKPAKEDLSVTVANQDKQIKLLIDRCATLEQERNLLKMDQEIHRDKLQLSHEQIDRMEEAAIRTRGWQDLAREILVPMFPSNAPGV